MFAVEVSCCSLVIEDVVICWKQGSSIVHWYHEFSVIIINLFLPFFLSCGSKKSYCLFSIPNVIFLLQMLYKQEF